MPDAVLVVGLGNPGPEYERTRHNLGYRVVDILCERLGARLRPLKGTPAFVAEARDGDHRFILAKPTTYMNVSGDAVGALMRYFKIPVSEVIIVHDDLDLSLGAVRVKRGGGDGGHNGLGSITRRLKTPDYVRVRLGIDRPHGRKDAADYVLEPFRKDEEDEVGVVLQEAADAVMVVARDGVDAAQQRFHASKPTVPKESRGIRKEAVVPAGRSEVWRAWTTAEGARAFFAPDARIELRPRGPYEIYFNPEGSEGLRGSDGCTVVAFRPEEFLVFTWNAPPSIPTIRNGKRKTRVEVRLEPEGDGRTRVTLLHTGWGKGEDWDRTYEYFERAWDVVLDRLQQRFERGPIDWSAG